MYKKNCLIQVEENALIKVSETFACWPDGQRREETMHCSINGRIKDLICSNNCFDMQYNLF